jgi:hypothetical protein
VSAKTTVEIKLTRAALLLMIGIAAAGASASLGGNANVASVLALAELDVIWITLLATGIVLRRRGSPLLAGWWEIAASLPPTPVRRAISFEVGLLTAIARVAGRRSPLVPTGAFAFTSKQGTLAIPIAFSVATVVEIVVLHLVVPWPALVGALTLISGYALLLLFGVIAVRWQHPHYVTPAALVLRNGVHTVATIPLNDIDTVVVRYDGSSTSPTVDRGIARLATLSGCSISIRLTAKHQMKLTAGRRANEHDVTEIRLAVDNARAMASFLSERVS